LKIAHLCLSNFYADGFSYQENELVVRHLEQGHNVIVIASTETVREDGRLIYVKPGEYIGPEGARVVRLPYRKGLPLLLARKIRAHPGVFRLLERERPDLIVFHSLCGFELLTAARYVARNASVTLLADSHEDRYNSARNALSKYVLHRLYYKSIFNLSKEKIKRILCISLETIDFVQQNYSAPKEKIEFFPLGADIPTEQEYLVRRSRARANLELGESQVMFLQTGKFDVRKKLADTLKAFESLAEENCTLVIAGSIPDGQISTVMPLISRNRKVKFLGWKAKEELKDLLCAADVYVQPGTQSATMQMSIGCRCAVILDRVPSHVPYVDGNGWLVEDSDMLADAMRAAAGNLELTRSMMRVSKDLAERMLDYRVLAKRITEIANG
jgi:1,2-diacylglycerol 3-alpha-glucosyltransferase